MFPIHDVNSTRIAPALTLLIIAANVGVFFAWQPLGDPVEEARFLYERAAIACEVTTGEPVTFREIASGRCVEDGAGEAPFPDKGVALSVVVSMFLHGGLLHLAGNMWFLWIFGNNVEEAFGHVGYAVLYLVAGLAATLWFVQLHPGSTDPLIGASGAIAGVLGAYLVLFPMHPIISLVFFYLLPVPALVFLGLWFAGQFAVQDPGVAWEAHAAGFLVGAGIALPLRGWLLRRVRALHR